MSEVPAIVREIPDAQRNPHLLEEIVLGLGNAPAAEAEEVLFELAENDPRFYHDRQWRSTALRLGTASSARRLVDLMVSGALNTKSFDEWHWRRELAGLISEHPEVRTYVRELLKDGPTSKHLEPLAHTVAEDPDANDLLMLFEAEITTGQSFLGWRSIENVVTAHVPSEHWKGTYNVVPIPAVELRQKLLALTSSGGADDPAARCLNSIDKLRDAYGAPEIEPRHPDLVSGRPWPILTPDPDVDDGV